MAKNCWQKKERDDRIVETPQELAKEGSELLAGLHKYVQYIVPRKSG